MIHNFLRVKIVKFSKYKLKHLLVRNDIKDKYKLFKNISDSNNLKHNNNNKKILVMKKYLMRTVHQSHQLVKFQKNQYKIKKVMILRLNNTNSLLLNK